MHAKLALGHLSLSHANLEEVNVGNTSQQPFDTMWHRQVKYQQEKEAIKYF